MALPPLAESLLTLVGMMVIALLIDWQLALISLSVVPLIYYSLGLYGTRIVPRLQRVQSLEGSRSRSSTRRCAMLRVIVSFGREDYEHRRFRDQGETAVDARVELTVRQTVFTLACRPRRRSARPSSSASASAPSSAASITVGELLVLLAYIASIYQPLEQISTTIGMLNEQLVS